MGFTNDFIISCVYIILVDLEIIAKHYKCVQHIVLLVLFGYDCIISESQNLKKQNLWMNLHQQRVCNMLLNEGCGTLVSKHVIFIAPVLIQYCSSTDPVLPVLWELFLNFETLDEDDLV